VAGPPEAGPNRPESQGDWSGDRQTATPAVGEQQDQLPAVPPNQCADTGAGAGAAGESDGDGGFQRERFLLRLVAVILIAEVLLFTGATIGCALLAQQRPLGEQSFCHRADRSLEAAFGVALNTLLALLGGKAASDSLR
jgi:hypothetical protein